MAACDNLYGNAQQWQQLYDFLKEKKPEYLHYMKEKPDNDDSDWRICYIASIQGYLLEECPFEWVQEKLDDNFFIQRMICGKAHHEEEEE